MRDSAIGADRNLSVCTSTNAGAAVTDEEADKFSFVRDWDTICVVGLNGIPGLMMGGGKEWSTKGSAFFCRRVVRRFVMANKIEYPPIGPWQDRCVDSREAMSSTADSTIYQVRLLENA